MRDFQATCKASLPSATAATTARSAMLTASFIVEGGRDGQGISSTAEVGLGWAGVGGKRLPQQQWLTDISDLHALRVCGTVCGASCTGRAPEAAGKHCPPASYCLVAVARQAATIACC